MKNAQRQFNQTKHPTGVPMTNLRFDTDCSKLQSVKWNLGQK